jgi:sugar phosphate isomerase/epimerase
MASDLFYSKNGIIDYMKLSIVLSTQPASFSALAYKGELEKNITKIKSLGYDGVELAVRDPALLDLSSLKSILEKNNLPLPAIGTGQAFGEEGLSLTNSDSEIRKKAVDRIKSHIVLSENFKSFVIIGLIRGKTNSNVNKDQAESLFVESLRICASENKKVKLAIEPINRYETDLINTVASGLNFLEKIGQDNVGLLLDTFHMNIEEPSITESIIAAKDHLFHFHIADSNRWHPGAGHIDFRKILDVLDRIDYKGFISAEILPLPDPDTAAEKTIGYMRKIVS